MKAWLCNSVTAVFLPQELPIVLDCTIPENTEAITPEEREELKVSGEDYWSLVCSDSIAVAMLVHVSKYVYVYLYSQASFFSLSHTAHQLEVQ